MPSQEEGQYHPLLPPVTVAIGSSLANVAVRVAIAPRAQPFDESMDSLSLSLQVAQLSGFRMTLEKVRRGAPGFQNCGPVIAHFLAAGETHLVLAADDLVYPPDFIVRLVNADKDIVSGIYRKNVLPRIEPANYVPTVETFMACLKEGGVYETEFAACHTMTIKRKVIEKMVKDYPQLEYDSDCGEIHYGLFLPLIHERKCYQDDWAFSIRARASGFTIWNDFGCKLKHYCGEFMGFEDLEAVNV